MPQATPAPTLAYLVSRYPAVSHTFILREVEQLRALGLRVEVASVNPPDRERAAMTPAERDEDASTYVLKRDGVRGALAALGWAVFTRPLATLRTLAAATRFGRGLGSVYALAYGVEALMVARWMARRGLRHLHVHFGSQGATVGSLVKTFCGVGLSITIHGPDEFDDVPGQQLRRKVEMADRIVCISQFARSQLMRLVAPAHWPKLSLCRLGVDLAQFQPRQRDAGAGPVRLLCVGRLTPAKGQMLLLQACAALQGRGADFRLVLVGDGPDRQALERAARELGLANAVRFTGALTAPQVQEELAQADLFVLPSLAEGIPVVLMEAMASGVPCITTPVNGIPELIENGHDGLLATPGDVQSLAATLGRALDDAALRQRLAGRARAKVQEAFDLQRNVRELAGIFGTLPMASTAESPR